MEEEYKKYYVFEQLINGNHLENYELLMAQKLFNKIEQSLKTRLQW